MLAGASTLMHERGVGDDRSTLGPTSTRKALTGIGKVLQVVDSAVFGDGDGDGDGGG